MTVVTPIQPDSTVQAPSLYKSNIEACISFLLSRLGHFAVHQRVDIAPNMTVAVDAGRVVTGTIAGANLAITNVAAQNSGTITAPVSNSRYDVIGVDPTGAVVIIPGTASASPTIPPITAGVVPLAAVLLTSATTAITNSIITDLYAAWLLGGNNVAAQLEMTGAGII